MRLTPPQTIVLDGRDGIRRSSGDLKPPMLAQAAELFSEGMTVRQVASILLISKSEAGRLRLRALADGILSPNGVESLEVSVQ